MSCWVCQGDPIYTDEHDLAWCQDHINIWKDAVRDTGNDPSF